MTVVNTTGGPARIAPLATETTHWYAVDGTPALAAEDGQLFVPNTVKVWHRPFKGWAVTISGQQLGDAKLAARVFAESRGDQLPALGLGHDWIALGAVTVVGVLAVAGIGGNATRPDREDS